MSAAITVVITTYNRAALVPLAIKSVLAQTHPASEIIVVDDGSRDDTRAVLAGFGDAIRPIHQANTGLSGARNAGINAARTEWVAFLDDDDEFAPERLAIAAESIRRFPAADAHLTNTAIVSPTGPDQDLFAIRGNTCTPWMSVDRPLSWVLRGCFFAQSLVARRSALLDAGLYRNTFYEDMDMFVRLVSRAPWIIDSRPSLRLIRRGNTSAMSDDWRSRPLIRGEALVRIHREALALPRLNSGEANVARTGLATHLFDLGRAHLAAGNRASANLCFAEAAKNFPALHSRIKSHAARWGGRPALALMDRLAPRRGGVVR